MRSARTHCGERVAARGCRCAARVRHRRGGGRGRAERRGGDRNAAGNAVRSRLRLPARGVPLSGFFGALPDAEVEEGAARDRKSVVSGTSVSVRVDLGGRRIIKQKKEDK